MGAIAFSPQLGKRGYIFVPLDQSRFLSNPFDQSFIKTPHSLTNRRIVGVDQEAFAVTDIHRVTRKMNFADGGMRNRIKVSLCAEAKIVGADINIVYIDQ